MADIAAMLTSGNNHWCSPAREAVDPVVELYDGPPDLDPASNRFSQMPARERWFKMDDPRDVLGRAMKAANKAGRPLAPSTQVSAYREIVRGLAVERDRHLAAGLIERDALVGDPWPSMAAVNVECSDGTYEHAGLRTLRGYLNPPYDEVAAFMDRLVDSYRAGAEWCALVVARTSSRWFHRTIWNAATAVCFYDHRLEFELEGATQTGAPFDSCMAYYGEHYTKFERVFSPFGKVIQL